MDKRSFLFTSLAATSALSFPSAFAQSSAAIGSPPVAAPGFKRIQLGAVQIIALNDGVTRRPLAEGFVRNAPLNEVKASLASQNLPTDYIDIPYTAYLVVQGNTRFLFDTGFADNSSPAAGQIRTNLAAAGFKPEDIDHVVISHFHGDHIQGLRYKDGALVYPNAKVHVPAPEYAFWMDDARMNAAPETSRGAFQAVRRVFGGMPADRLLKFEPGAVLVPGITSAPAFGHSPGMSIFTVESEGKKFTYVADVTNVPAIFARNPDWAVAFDMDPEAARQTRRRIYDMLVRDKTLVGGFHFPQPWFGTLEAAGTGYQFKPISQ